MRRPRRIGLLTVAITLMSGLAIPAPGHALEPADSGVDDTQSPLQVPGVGNVAHKGASLQAPENTLAAVRQAIAQHANFIGIDVHRTSDKRLVVLHDNTLARTTNVEELFPDRAPWNVASFTLDEINRLDAGSWKSTVYLGQRVPTLRQVLTELAPSSTGLFLEIKAPQMHGWVDGIGDQVVAQIKQHTSWLAPDGAQDRLVVQAFDDSFLEDFEAKYDDVVVGTLGGVARLDDYVSWADQVNVHYRDVTPEMVDQAHAGGLAVSTYVVNDLGIMRRVIDAGVDAVSTDRPQRLYDELLLHERVMADPGRPAPDKPWATSLTLSTPDIAVLPDRVPVTVKISTTDGRPAAWTWVQLQRRIGDTWHTLQRRATDRLGTLRTTVASRRQLHLRAVSEPNEWYRGAQAERAVEVRSAATRVRLYGDTRTTLARPAQLHVRWVADGGVPITGPAGLWSMTEGDRWRPLRGISITNGTAELRVRRRKSTRFQVRTSAGSWWAADRDSHYIQVPRPGQPPRG
jgi:glycerophosphoryl diester phosphodiesterase